MRDGRLAESQADLVELRQIRVGQIRKALAEVLDGLVHPVALIVFGGLQDAATIDVTEELVSSPVHELLFTQSILPLSFVRAHARLRAESLQRGFSPVI
jgi:hypothetical protein